jgi:GT2 family glycosyltransferase
MSKVKKVAIIAPVFGRHDLTSMLLNDLAVDGNITDIWLVDNHGSFDGSDREVIVVRPGDNLRWGYGCNFGVLAAWGGGYEFFILINNDVRLSPLFVEGLIDAALATDGDLIGPMYDHYWPHQRGRFAGAAANYVGRSHDFQAPFIDGTCMLIRRSTFQNVGLLDTNYWPMYGWGCDKDFALRVRKAGGTVWVTERSYLNHFARQTAMQFAGYSDAAAELENDEGMFRKWGKDWRDLLYAGFDDVVRGSSYDQSI